MKDICFTKEKSWFRYRTGAFILKDDKMLFVKSKFGGYFYMIGGGVSLGENSVDTTFVDCRIYSKNVVE